MISKEMILSIHDGQRSVCLVTALLFQGYETEPRPLDHALDYWKCLDLAQRTNFCALQHIMDWHLIDMTGSRLLSTIRLSKAQIPWMFGMARNVGSLREKDFELSSWI